MVAAADDDGSAPERLLEALRLFRARDHGEGEVVDALRRERLLLPLIAESGGGAVTDDGLRITHELSTITVAAPDGRRVLPVFTSVAAMAVWSAVARPVPVEAVRVALAAASEGTDLLIIDPGSETEFAVRRPAVWAIAQGNAWKPSYLDLSVLAEFLSAAEPESSVVAVQLAPGDPDARLVDAELLVHLSLVNGLDRASLDVVVERMQQRWAGSEIIAERVDSMRVQLVGAA